MLKPLTLGTVIGFLSACGGSAAPELEPRSTELTSPAGPDSGEPYLSSSGDAVHMSWLQAGADGGHELRFATWRDNAWSDPKLVAASERFFVNWADFPSITAAADGTLWAHWLERGAAGGYDYGVRIVRSSDEGTTWSEPWTPHADASPTEHGFVATFPTEEGMGFVWLDGRGYAESDDRAEGDPSMTLRYAAANAHGEGGAEVLVDGRVCDCCQTDAAVAASGPVVVYRDRSDGDIRDIYVTRLVDGTWTEGRAVHDDGWHINACPVNGPAVAARDDLVAVAWFTGADDVAVANAAFSLDGGRTFGAPVRIDDGQPAGRVDVLVLADGTALVSWLERTGGEVAEVRLRRITPEGLASASVTVAGSSEARASGFPRLALAADGAIVMAWTDVAGPEPVVRTQRLEIDE